MKLTEGITVELLEWDARVYDGLPLPHKRWGAQMIERLALSGSETVVDFGCGTGRDAESLLRLLPGGRVIAVDGSQQMLDQLRIRLPDVGAQLRVVRADLRELLDLGEVADAALSIATLHWLPDHAVVFANAANVLRPGGRFVAEAGGRGNLGTFREAVVEVSGDDGSRFWNFAGVDETIEKLRKAGFGDIDVRLVDDAARLERGEQLESFIATVLLGAQLRELKAAERRPFVQAVARQLPEPVIDYVRLQISAVRR